MFRSLDSELIHQVEEPLPKLKDIIINLTMPRGYRFVQDRVCHCSLPQGIDLPYKKATEWWNLTLDNTKAEVIRLLGRLSNPRRVVVRYPRLHDKYEVDTETAYEWNALTGEIQRLPIDEWGVVMEDVEMEFDPDYDLEAAEAEAYRVAFIEPFEAAQVDGEEQDEDEESQIHSDHDFDHDI
jgi:hypothetical protein